MPRLFLIFSPQWASKQRLLGALLPILIIAIFQSGPACHKAFATTSTASISVSVIVQAGCQVSPAPSTSGPNGGRAPISMNCTLPVPYQVSVESLPQTNSATLGSTGLALATLSGPDRPLLSKPLDWPIESATSPAYARTALITSGFPAVPIEAAPSNVDGADSKTLTVTITY